MYTTHPAYRNLASAFVVLSSVLLFSCGGDNDSSSDEDTGCTPSGDSECTNTVFVTDAIMTGGFAAGSAIGALPEADAICQAEANLAGLSGTYFAWISVDAANSPAGIFTQSTDPYVLPTGEVVADNWADLIDGSLQTEIDVNASGGTPAGVCPVTNVWTATTISGTPNPNNCSGWTNNGGIVDRGISNSATGFWTDLGGAICSFSTVCGAGSEVGGRLYCFEQ